MRRTGPAYAESVSRSRAWFALPGAVLAVLAGLAMWPQPSTPGTVLTSHLDAPRIPHPCEGGATHEFIPTTVDIEHVGAAFPVLALPRDVSDTPRTPPVSAKRTVAFDAPGNKPGGSHGNVLLNTHTWPDGSALGNALLAKTDVGDLFVMRRGSAKLCYKITRKIEVPASADYPDFWIEDGPPQMAIIVCSGRRLGPGNWSHRTIWFGTPWFGA